MGNELFFVEYTLNVVLVAAYAAAVADAVTLSVMTPSSMRKKNIISNSFPDNQRMYSLHFHIIILAYKIRSSFPLLTGVRARACV